MRTFLRRLIIICILLVVLYLLYGRINPSWAQKIKSQLQEINFPREKVQERAQDILIKDITPSDEYVENTYNTWDQDNLIEDRDKGWKNKWVDEQEDEFDWKSYLEWEQNIHHEWSWSNTHDNTRQNTEPINKKTDNNQVTQPQEGIWVDNDTLQTPPSSDTELEVSDAELREIQDILNSLLE